MAGAIDKLHSMCIAVVDGEERAAGGAGGLVQSPSILSDNGTLSDNRMVRVRVCRGAMCVFICVCVCTCIFMYALEVILATTCPLPPCPPRQGGAQIRAQHPWRGGEL